MQSAIHAIKKFQTVALVVTGGSLGYYWLSGSTTGSRNVTSTGSTDTPNSRKGHTLSGQEIDADKQVD